MMKTKLRWKTGAGCENSQPAKFYFFFFFIIYIYIYIYIYIFITKRQKGEQWGRNTIVVRIFAFYENSLQPVKILGLRNFATCQNSQVAKFATCEIFAGCEILVPILLHQNFDKNCKNKHRKIKKICRKMKINIKAKIN